MKKMYRSEIILKRTEIDKEAKIIENIESVLAFAKDIIAIHQYPEEVIFVLCLSTDKNVLDYFSLSSGTITQSAVGLKELFKRVLISNAHSFLLVHNHPNAEANPSAQDIEVTSKILQASKIMDTEFIDHIIIGDSTFFSFRANGKDKNEAW